MKRKQPSMSPPSSTDSDKTYQSTVIDENPSSLNVNLLKERNIDQENVLKCKIYVCQACSFASKDKTALMLHEREQHFCSMSSPPSSPGPPKLKHICVDCCFETSSSNKFKKHRFKRHGVLFIDNDGASKLLDLGATNVISDHPYGTVKDITPAGILGDEEDFKLIKRARIPKNLSDSPLSHHTEEEGPSLEKEGNNHQDLGFNGCCRLGLQLETFGNKEDEIFEKDYNFISCHLGPCLVENGQHLTVHFQPIVMNGIDQALGELGKSQKLEEKSTASSSSFTEQTDQRDSSTPLPCAKILNKMDHLNSNRIGKADEPNLVSSYSSTEEMDVQKSQLPSDIKITFAALDKVQSELDMIYISCCEIEASAEQIKSKIQQLEELEKTRGAEEIQLSQEKERLTKLFSSIQRDKWKAEHHLRTIQIKLLKTTLQLNSSMSAVSPPHTEPDAETMEAESQMNTLAQELTSVQEKLKEVSEELANVCESRQCAVQLLEVFREELKRNTSQKKSLMVRQLIAYDRMKQLKAEQEAHISEYVRLKEQDAFQNYKNVETKLELKEKDMLATLSAFPVSEENV